MSDTNQHEVVESLFERNQRRETEINEALKLEAERHAAAVRNMHRLRALRLARVQNQTISNSAISEVS